MNIDFAAEPTAAPVPLDERLNEAAREERQRALRALLQQPLLTADDTGETGGSDVRFLCG